MDNNDLSAGSKIVRMFYSLILKYTIHDNAVSVRTGKKNINMTDEELEEELRDYFSVQLEEMLEPLGYQIAFDIEEGVRSFEKQQLTYLVPFLVSKVHEFNAEDIITPESNSLCFKVKDRVFSSAQEILAQNIRDTLGTNMAIHEIVFSMATSRIFVFELFYEGSFRVKREFSDEEIEYNDGVRGALRSFFDEIESAIEPFGFEITSAPSIRQRSRNDEYLFGVYYASRINFNESKVLGAGCYAIRGDASIDEINDRGIDYDDSFVDETDSFLSAILNENLPPDVDLIFSEIRYVDDLDEAFAIDDEFVC